MNVKVKYHAEDSSELGFVGGYEKSCAIDLYTAEEVRIKSGQSALIDLGVSIELPEGHQAILIPRSSTFKKYGIIQTNSIGLIDESYKGDNDKYMLPVFRPITMLDTVQLMANYTANLFMPTSEEDATPMILTNLKKVENKLDLLEMTQGMVVPMMTETVIPKGTNICQIMIVPRMEEMTFEKVETLGNENRDGFGSTDENK